MIVQATRIGRKGGVQYLAQHLLDKLDDNARIEILAGDRAALHDAQALADVKGCRYSVRHLSISPEKEMSPLGLSAFLRMVDAEFKIGPERPRLLVRHIKHGRAHFHLAVAEVDPVSFRVLDCRQDFARLEDIARRYEAEHGEDVQPSRAERRANKVEGFSEIARKRAERTSPGFHRSRLKTAFDAGADVFRGELKSQGLRLADGNNGPILVTDAGVFVAAANRAVGVRKNEFLNFLEAKRDGRLIGTQTSAPATARDGRAQHQAAPAAVESVGDAGRPGSHRAIDRIARAHPRRPATAGRGIEVRHGQIGSPLPALTGRSREDVMLARLNRELDDLLRRARELAGWIKLIFEPEPDRLARQIAEVRKRKLFPPPADAAKPSEPTYDFRRRTMP